MIAMIAESVVEIAVTETGTATVVKEGVPDLPTIVRPVANTSKQTPIHPVETIEHENEKIGMGQDEKSAIGTEGTEKTEATGIHDAEMTTDHLVETAIFSMTGEAVVGELEEVAAAAAVEEIVTEEDEKTVTNSQLKLGVARAALPQRKENLLPI